MITNSPFETHGIGHLSASQINSWVSNPAGYLAQLAGMTYTVGPSAWRGTAAEVGIHDVITGGDNTIKTALGKFYSESIENGPVFSESAITKERSSIPYYIEHGSALYNNLGKLEDYQKKIVV